MKSSHRLFYFLLLSLPFLIYVACSPVKKYEKLPEVTAWENDIREFERLDKSSKYADDAILFAGSSSIRLWNTLEQDMKPYNVIQRGYGGAKLSDFAVYAERIIAPHPCRAIVLFIANDITGDAGDKEPEEVGKLFRHLLMTIRKTHPDTPVYWIAVTPTPSRWAVWDEIKKAGEQINSVCKKDGNAWYIRTDQAFLDESGKPRSEFFIDDQLHLNQDGYALWTSILKKELDLQ